MAATIRACGDPVFKPISPSSGDAVDEQAFRDALRRFASGVTVITTRDEHGAPHGMTATAFSSLSLHPPLVLVAVAHGTRCHRLVTARRQFGVNILYEHQSDLSRHFGGSPQPDLDPLFTDLAGVPVLERAMVKLACRLEEPMRGGDHSIFVGLVTGAMSAPGAPLLHFEGQYHGVAPHAEA